MWSGIGDERHRGREEVSYGTPNRPEDQKRLARVLRILYLLEEAPYRHTRAALAKRFDVGLRTVDNDLELLRGVGYDIKRHPEGYSIDAWPEFATPASTRRRRAGYRESRQAEVRAKQQAQTRLEQTPPAHYHPVWTTTEDRFLVEHGEMTAAEIGAALGRTEAAAYQRRYRLRRAWREAHPEHGMHSIREAAEALGEFRTVKLDQRRRRRETCKRGHPLTEENVRINDQGYRNCRTCLRARDARYRAAQKEKKAD